MRAHLLGIGVIGSLWFVLAEVFACLLYPSYNPLVQASSELTASGAPLAVILVMNSGKIAFGISLLVVAFCQSQTVIKNHRLEAGCYLLAVFGLVSIVGVLFPMDSNGHGTSLLAMVHGAVYALGILVVLSLILIFVGSRLTPALRVYSVYTLLTPFLMLGLNGSGIIPEGLSDLLGASMVSLWVTFTSIKLLRALS